MKLASGALLLLCLSSAASSQDSDLLKQKLAAFQKEFHGSGAGDDEKAQAIVALAQLKTEDVAKVLAPILTKASLQVRVVAARELARFQGVKGAGSALLAGLRARVNQGEKARSIRILSLRGLGDLKVAEGAGDVEGLLDDKNQWIAKSAVEAAGKIRSRSSIDPLIEALRKIEGPDGNLDIGVNPLEAELPPHTLEQILKSEVKGRRGTTGREFLRDPILGALKSITGREHAGARDWESWWRKNKATFQVVD